MSARASERSINVELPTRQAIFAPQPSVHALKPLTKILSFDPPARKPLKAERCEAAPAWSTDVKSRGRGLIGAETAGFFQKEHGGLTVGLLPQPLFFAKSGPQPIFRPISRNF